MNAVSCRGLRFAYGPRGVDLEVAAGEMVALVGVNGAGKTTTMELLIGHRRPAGGTIRVLGRDPYAERRRLATEVGVVPQDSGLAPDLTVTETLRLWLRLHRRPVATELLGAVDLEHRAGMRVRQLSGGERRRLDLAVALCGRPRLLLLDEPTSGLDPDSRARTWKLLREHRDAGTSVLVSTHYPEEAEGLADRIVVMDGGMLR
ncbi:ABC transporter ATP-binding protein [Actinoplanes lobatus]|uniref:ABC-2 type transport system ATP-binding protein n=2 Tax=Actinoplanes lobatus TaxID=113568 RepID=A0A7W7HND1_9ACTN|nr:ABC transporter ATP-binding protein [Actinoplanes lobatus]MBB4753713.1 ABC-2 type transport system ATP-binding protein [Actinoplanes lobatus]